MPDPKKSQDFDRTHLHLRFKDSPQLKFLAERLNKIRLASFPKPSFVGMSVEALQSYCERRERELFGVSKANEIQQRALELRGKA